MSRIMLQPKLTPGLIWLHTIILVVLLVLFAWAVWGQEPAGDRAGFPLHDALAQKDYDEAIRLIRLGADVNELSDRGARPLVVASDDPSSDAFDVVRELLRFGALPNEADSDGQTALHRAAEQGNMAVADLLVRSGADLNATRPVVNLANGETVEHTPILRAYVRGHFRVADYLQSMGAAVPAHAESAKFLGRLEGELESYLERPRPEGVSAEDWNRMAVQMSMREAHPELGRWMNDLRDLNPEMEAAYGRMMAEPVPEGVSRLEWAKRQTMELLRKAQMGEIEIVAPSGPRPALDDPGQ
ncbi:MAG: ankyrin repeat domain-containing protein [Acidobacteriia bacterium]|nr:ankyrin repeat domain-containing protein [Terriglobia bacterium]